MALNSHGNELLPSDADLRKHRSSLTQLSLQDHQAIQSFIERDALRALRKQLPVYLKEGGTIKEYDAAGNLVAERGGL